jgi:putative nucleotidyltransferase with HDIG domain
MLKLPENIISFMEVFKKNRYQIYIVGGAVRDLLLGRRTPVGGVNWDFATDATPEEITDLFPDSFYNNKYGTVGIPQKIDDKEVVFEVTPFRKEREYKDMRHPEKIEWAETIEEDLARRDFTVNAIAYDGKKLVDPYEGQKHLREKMIVAVGDPDTRFKEDALRLMRAIRFSSELGFFIEDKTRDSIQKNASLITNISGERIRDELFKILVSDNPAEGILFMRNTGLLTFVLPELDLCFVVPQKSPKRHHIYDVGTHSVMALKYTPSKNPVTRLGALLHDVGKATTFRKDEETGLITFYNHEVVGERLVSQIADRLRLSGKEKDKLVKLVRHHQFSVSELQTDKAVRRFIREVGRENIQDMLDLRTGDRIGSGAKPTSWRLELFKKRIEEVQKEPFKVTDLKIDGEDVMKIMKIKPGPKVGQVLRKIFDEVVEGKLKNEREALLKKIEEFKE